jgi:hypothetical protein
MTSVKDLEAAFKGLSMAAAASGHATVAALAAIGSESTRAFGQAKNATEQWKAAVQGIGAALSALAPEMRQVSDAGADMMTFAGSTAQGFAQGGIIGGLVGFFSAGLTLQSQNAARIKAQAAINAAEAMKADAEAFTTLNTALERYGYAVNGVSGLTAELGKGAATLVGQWTALHNSGLGINDVTVRMADDIRALEQKYTAAGVAIPGSLQAVIDKLAALDAQAGRPVGVGLATAVEDARKLKEAMSAFSTQDALSSAADQAGKTYQAMVASGLYATSTLTTAWRQWQDAMMAAGQTGGASIDDLNGLFVNLGAAAAATGQAMPARFDAIVLKMQDLGIITDEAAAAIAGMQAGAAVDYKAMEEAAGRYGLSVDNLGGRFNSAQMGDAAKSLLTDYQLLTNGGADVGTVLSGMGDDLNAFIVKSISLGTEVPAQFKPLAEELLRTGQLFTEDHLKLDEFIKKTAEGGVSMPAALEKTLAGYAATGNLIDATTGKQTTFKNLVAQFGKDAPKDLQEFLAKLGTLSEKAGDGTGKMTDLKNVQFGAPLVTEFDKVALKIDELITKLAAGLGIQLSTKLPADAAAGVASSTEKLAKLPTTLPVDVTFKVDPLPTIPPIPTQIIPVRWGDTEPGPVGSRTASGGEYHTGGLVSLARRATSSMAVPGWAPRFHSGGEVPAVLQTGEFVVSRKGVQAIGLGVLGAINSGAVANSQPTGSQARGDDRGALMPVTVAVDGEAIFKAMVRVKQRKGW